MQSPTDDPGRREAMLERLRPLALPALAELAAAAERYAALNRAARTTDAYRRDWCAFEGWCRDAGLASLPAQPSTVALYLASLAETRSVSTMQRRLAAIAAHHREHGLTSPTTDEEVRRVWTGIRRTWGAPPMQKDPLLVEDLRRVVDGIGTERAIDVRDRALLLVGYAGAFRRSELVAVDVGHLRRRPDGLVVSLPRSKTDQYGSGRTAAIPLAEDRRYCPVEAVDRWLSLSGISSGAVFRPVDRHGNVGQNRLSAKAVAEVVKRRGAAVGLDAERLAGHSLRAGLATSAALRGVPEWVIARSTGHRSTAMVQRYIRAAEMFTENAARAVGL